MLFVPPCCAFRAATHGVSFDIPFDKDELSEIPSVPNRGMTRSASTEGLGFKVHHMPRGLKRNLSFQPVNGTSVGIEEEGCPDSLAGMEPDRRQRPPHPRMHLSSSNGLPLVSHGNGTATPSIEEALEIIHNSQKQQQQKQRGSQAQGTNQGFFLHLQGHLDLDSKAVAEEDDLDSVSSKGAASTNTTEVDTGIHVRTEDIQETLDEDSSLKDCTVSMDLDMDQDYEMRASHSQGSVSPCPSNLSGKSPSSGGSLTPGGVKMTSFAEQKFQKIIQPKAKVVGSSGSPNKVPEGSETTQIPHSVSWAPTPEESPAHNLVPRDPAQAMAAEMVQLRMRLEEKRRAIEAQKKKVEAAFTRHRQKMGRSAFLNVVRRKGDETPSPMKEEAEDAKAQATEGAVSKPDTAQQQQPLKSPGGEEGVTEADLLEYTRSIDKLNASLNFLQTEMQRLAQQQEVIMQMREQQSWVIAHSPQKGRTATAARSSGSPSPADSPRSAHRSPTSIKRKSASFHSKTTRAPRPNELKIAPFSRVLTAPQSVDSLPRLRRFSPSHPEPSCFVYMGESKKKQRGAKTVDKEAASDSELLSPDGVIERRRIGTVVLPKSPTKDMAADKTTIADDEEWEKASEMKEEQQGFTEQTESKKPDRKVKPAVESNASEVLTQTIREKVIVTPTEAPADFLNQSNKNLIEVPLSVLKPLDGAVLEESGEQGATTEGLDDDQKTCCGFFFKV